MCDCLVRSEYACLPGEVICCTDNTYMENDVSECACDRVYCAEGALDFSEVSSCECAPVAPATGPDLPESDNRARTLERENYDTEPNAEPVSRPIAYPTNTCSGVWYPP